jgi:NAD(P)-dependent dehydrogenase (short-subunit alcohol dehydrogenase family)
MAEGIFDLAETLRLRGRTVVILGYGGIGLACARLLATRGYDILLVARREEPLRAAAESIGARWISADCSEEDDVGRVFEDVERLDLLVHAAGIYEGGLVRRQGIESFDRVIKANLRSSALLAQSALRVMDAGSRIVFIGSVAGIEGTPTVSAYSAAKGGLRAYASALAGEVEHHGIAVHLVTTGAVDTPMFGEDAQRVESLSPEEVAEIVGWLESAGPHVVIREIVVRAVEAGPYATGKISMREATTRPATKKKKRA